VHYHFAEYPGVAYGVRAFQADADIPAPCGMFFHPLMIRETQGRNQVHAKENSNLFGTPFEFFSAFLNQDFSIKGCEREFCGSLRRAFTLNHFYCPVFYAAPALRK
jgi:hypothetical protein